MASTKFRVTAQKDTRHIREQRLKRHLTHPTSKLLQYIVVLEYPWFKKIIWLYATNVVWLSSIQGFKQSLKLLLYNTNIKNKNDQ
jgi:hypothetical protein